MVGCRRTSRFVRFLAPFAVATALSLPTTPVALGEVTSKVTRSKIDVPRVFRSELLRQLRSIEVNDLPDSDRVVLSASLVRLETTRTGDRAESTCVVSATLRKKRGGALVAILRGRARAQDAIDAKADNEMVVMRAAVRSTVRGIPKALK